MSFDDAMRHSEFARQSAEKIKIWPFFDLEELLNRGHYIDAMQDRELAQATHNATRHLEMLRYKIKELGEKQLSRPANYQWNERDHYERMMAESPVGYVIHERFPNFVIDDVCYRFDIIQLGEGIALRVLQDTAATIKEREKKYFERYEGLASDAQQKEMEDLLRSLLGNLRKDLQSDIAAALDKATSPEKSPVNEVPGRTPTNRDEKRAHIESFYDSILFMGMLAQRCAARKHPQLGLLIML
jgi:hypothetical protein